MQAETLGGFSPKEVQETPTEVEGSPWDQTLMKERS